MTKPIIDERHIIKENLFVSRYAAAPGVTSIATTKMLPTVCSAAIAVTASSVSNKRYSALVLSPIERACAGSNEKRRKSYHLSRIIVKPLPAIIRV